MHEILTEYRVRYRLKLRRKPVKIKSDRGRLVTINRVKGKECDMGPRYVKMLMLGYDPVVQLSCARDAGFKLPVCVWGSCKERPQQSYISGPCFQESDAPQHCGKIQRYSLESSSGLRRRLKDWLLVIEATT